MYLQYAIKTQSKQRIVVPGGLLKSPNEHDTDLLDGVVVSALGVLQGALRGQSYHSTAWSLLLDCGRRRCDLGVPAADQPPCSRISEVAPMNVRWLHSLG
jgi:hypothetical protein